MSQSPLRPERTDERITPSPHSKSVSDILAGLREDLEKIEEEFRVALGQDDDLDISHLSFSQKANLYQQRQKDYLESLEERGHTIVQERRKYHERFVEAQQRLLVEEQILRDHPLKLVVGDIPVSEATFNDLKLLIQISKSYGAQMKHLADSWGKFATSLYHQSSALSQTLVSLKDKIGALTDNHKVEKKKQAPEISNSTRKRIRKPKASPKDSPAQVHLLKEHLAEVQKENARLIEGLHDQNEEAKSRIHVVEHENQKLTTDVQYYKDRYDNVLHMRWGHKPSNSDLANAEIERLRRIIDEKDQAIATYGEQNDEQLPDDTAEDELEEIRQKVLTTSISGASLSRGALESREEHGSTSSTIDKCVQRRGKWVPHVAQA